MSKPELTLLDMVMNSLFQYTGAYSLSLFLQCSILETGSVYTFR
jgi:hypothetical protein